MQASRHSYVDAFSEIEHVQPAVPGPDDAHELEFVPILRPQLPSADSIMDYLRRIDGSRIYSNFGPLVIEFQTRLESFFGIRTGSVVSANSGTSALIGAILATAGTATASRPLALMPSFSFAATSVAAERCGFRPYFLDVDLATWALDPAALENHPCLDKAGVVVVVAPFGRPVPQSPWIRFEKTTGIPVVIDAAASFSCIGQLSECYFGPVATVLSFHATKSFGIGEGGCVVSTKAGMLDRLVAALNFGFMSNRDSAFPSINGRLSEFHAAVGLASLNSWTTKCAGITNVTHRYRSSFAAAGLAERFFAWPDVDGNYALYLCQSGIEASELQRHLEKARIDFRFWYGSGLHRHQHFSAAQRDTLTVTDLLGQRLIGLPMAPDLNDKAIQRVVAAVSTSATAWRAHIGREPDGSMGICKDGYALVGKD